MTEWRFVEKGDRAEDQEYYLVTDGQNVAIAGFLSDEGWVHECGPLIKVRAFYHIQELPVFDADGEAADVLE